MIRKLALIAGGLWLGRKYLRGQPTRENAPGANGLGLSPSGGKDATGGQAGFAPTDALSAAREPSTGHVPNDLLSDAHPDGNARVDDHFRPNPTAPVPPEDRESLRPVTAPAPRDPPGRPDQ